MQDDQALPIISIHTAFKEMVAKQRHFFASGVTLPLAFRIEQLKKLKHLIETHEADLADALKKDLHKSHMESVGTEIMLLIAEINFVIKKLKKWVRPHRVKTLFPLLWPGQSTVHYEPYGLVLIISPWNYPLFLSLSPLIGAMASGNCAILKPSEIATHTQNILVKLFKEYFAPEYVAIVAGDGETVKQLLQEKFDYLFFTGSTHIGKIIMEAAAKHLTPVTLELGGKSPCIVDETANLDFAARRIIWGKMTNAGQTCVAPDYLYVHESCKQALVTKLIQAISQFFGANPEESKSFGRIINDKHFTRLMQLLPANNILYGGESHVATRYIAPTLLSVASWNEPIMQQEIFGPILPILTYRHINEVIAAIAAQPKPLALYLFTKNKMQEKTILTALSFGGGCINDCLLHLANYHLPFGGVGASGLGAYHGQYSFELFSHRKGIYKKMLPIDFNLAYPPYSEKKLWWLKKLLRL